MNPSSSPHRFRALGFTLFLLLSAGVFAALPLFPRPASANVVTTPPAPASGEVLQEAFAFQLRDLPVRHQGGNTLGVSVRYTYVAGIKDEEYPDFRLLAQTCEEFLSHYPQESAFWEIVNKGLTQTLIEKFPTLSVVTVELQVAANSRIPYARTSTVTRRRVASATD